jgi:hypothetical protein
MNSVKAILILENNGALSGVTGTAPAVLVDVLGKNTLQRTIDSLADAGLAEVIVVTESNSASPELRELTVQNARIFRSEATNVWRTAEQLFVTCAESASQIFIMRLNAYMELNWEAIVRHHRKHGNRVTRVATLSNVQPIDVCLISASRRNDAAFLLRSGLRQSRTACVPYELGQEGDEYINLLEHEFDIRRLASDALHRDCKMRPYGTEIRPGIWAAPGSRIDRHARLVAPVYIGRRARICAGAVITRGSAVEHHSLVGRGTVVENSTILPLTRLGPGLDICNSLVGEAQIFHLQKNLSTTIHDPALVGQISARAGMRMLTGTASLISYLPRQILSGLFGSPPQSATTTPINYAESLDSVNKEHAEMTAGLAVARRYGNQ